MYNLNDTITYPGKNIVSYSWLDIRHSVDFSTEDKMASVTFDVTASGRGTIESYIE